MSVCCANSPCVVAGESYRQHSEGDTVESRAVCPITVCLLYFPRWATQISKSHAPHWTKSAKLTSPITQISKSIYFPRERQRARGSEPDIFKDFLLGLRERERERERTGRGVKLSEEHLSIYLRATAKLGVMKGHNFINEGGNLNKLE